MDFSNADFFLLHSELHNFPEESVHAAIKDFFIAWKEELILLIIKKIIFQEERNDFQQKDVF